MVYSFIVKEGMEDIFSGDEIITSSLQETQAIARQIIASLDSEHVVALYGDLGAGKTTFSQGIGKALGIERHLQSPTFTIVKVYSIPSHSQFETLQHVDLYRLEKESEMKAIGLDELIDDPKSLVLIEWADKLGTSLPKNRIDVFLEYVDESKRKLVVKRINENDTY